MRIGRALLVTTFYGDDHACWRGLQHAPDASFDYAPVWLQDAIATAFRNGAARMAIAGPNPALLAEQDPAKVARANVAASKASKPAMELITRHEINWTIVAAATPEWAKLVFPGEPEEMAMAKLWEAIFAASRITGDDPVADWRAHGARLKERVDLLNAKRYAALHFRRDGETDLKVGLADQHLWAGGGTTAGNGVYCQPNIPTEECFTTPHKDRVDGVVRASKPLSHQGTLIENIRCRFEGGKIVEATATRGRGRAEPADLDRRRRAAAGRGGAGAGVSPIAATRDSLLEHAVRRERGEPHCAGPGVFDLPDRRGEDGRRRSCGAGREREPDPRGLDDRVGGDGCGRRCCGWQAEPLMRGGEWV